MYESPVKLVQKVSSTISPMHALDPVTVGSERAKRNVPPTNDNSVDYTKKYKIFSSDCKTH